MTLVCLVIGDHDSPSPPIEQTRSPALFLSGVAVIPFGPAAIPGVDGPVLQRLENLPAQPFTLPPLESRIVSDLMVEQAWEDAAAPERREPIYSQEFEFTERRNLPPNPNAPALSQWPPPTVAPVAPLSPSVARVLSSLEGPDVTVSGFVPPDSMGDVGPTQFIAALNGRIRSYDKRTLTADGVLDVTPNTFFSSVRNGANTADPRIRFDPHTNRWFIIYITVAVPTRTVMAFSDTATITGSTTWSYTFLADTVVNGSGQPCLGDYATLGIDANALYIGTNEVCGATLKTLAYFASAEFIIPKATLIAGAGTSAGFLSNSYFTPQGVDNHDASPSFGYFVSVDNASFGVLRLSQISNPATPSPSMVTTSITVLATSFPRSVPHSGGAKNLDGLDDRLMTAVARNGRIWTAHAICVSEAGVASDLSTCRNGVRWYELSDIATDTPAVNQSGTIFDSAATNPRHYWLPSVDINSQSVVVMGFASAGAGIFAGAAFAQRESTDPLGTMQATIQHLDGLAAYNTDAWGTNYRWGDYSMVSVDPSNDATFWTIQEYSKAAATWGTMVTRLAEGAGVAPTIRNIPNLATSEDTAIGPIDFGVTDADTPAGSLLLSAASSNPAVVPVPGIVFGGTGESRTLTITPAANASGITTITLSVSDGMLTTADTFQLIVTPVNDAPAIDNVADQILLEDRVLGPLAFAITDAETAAGALTVTASSSNATLVPASGLTLAGSAGTRSVTITPAANESGTTTVTLTVSDGVLTARDVFLLTVSAVNDPPSIRAIADQSVQQDGTVAAFPLVIGDIDSPEGSLVVSATSGNTTLLANSGIVIAWTGFTRTLALTPAGGQSGATTVTVTVSDTSTSVSTNFTLTVHPSTGPPSAPLNFVAALTENTLMMSWDPPLAGAPPTDYVLQVALDASFTALVFEQSSRSAARPMAVADVPTGTFHLRVRARNAFGTGPASNVQRIGDPPNPPNNFVATLSGTTLTMTWAPPAPGASVADYLVEAALTASFNPVVYSQGTSSSTTSLVIPGVPPGTFFLRLRARNGSGVSIPSNTQGIGPGACSGVPGPATAFTITRLGGLNVRLGWTAPGGADSATDYVIQAATDGSFSTLVFSQPLGSSATTLDAIAPPGTFFVRIIATNACGAAAPSSVVNLILP